MMQVPYISGDFAIDHPEKSMTEVVKDLQTEMIKLPQYEPQTTHFFHGGMYCRQVFRHAGVLIVGKTHKKEHFYIVLSGTVVVTTDYGVQELNGPIVVCSTPGTKRAVYAVTDAVCLTIHRTDSTNLDDIEKELIEPEDFRVFNSENKLITPNNEVLPS